MDRRNFWPCVAGFHMNQNSPSGGFGISRARGEGGVNLFLAKFCQIRNIHGDEKGVWLELMFLDGPPKSANTVGIKDWRL